MATNITTSAIGVNNNETVYTGTATTTLTEYAYARNQNYLRIKNNGIAKLFVIVETDGQRTINVGEEIVINAVFLSFKIKSESGSISFTAIAKNDIVIWDEVSEVKAANTNQAVGIAKKGFAALEQRLNARVDEFINKHGQYLYVDRITTAFENHDIDDLILCGKTMYKSSTNVYSDTWSEGCTLAHVSTSGLQVNLLNGSTAVKTYTYGAVATLRSVGNVYDVLMKDKIIRRVGIYSTAGVTFTSANVLSSSATMIFIKLPIDIDVSIPIEYRNFKVQGIKIADDNDISSGVRYDKVNRCLILALSTANQIGAGVAGATLLDKANTWLSTNTVIVTYKKQTETTEAVSNNVFDQISFTGDLNYTTSDTNLNPAVIAKVRCSRSELKDFLLNHNGVSYNGQLSRVGTNLVNAKGKTVQLRGIGTHNLLTYTHMQTFEGLRTLKYYGVNVLRLTAYTADRTYIKSNPSWIAGAISAPTETRTRMDELISWCKALDMYVIVDWHNLQGEDILTTAFVNGAKAFFSYFSTKYPADPYIIYELLNEPHDRTDADIASYINQVASSVTTNSPNAILICGVRNVPASMKTTYDAIQAAVTLTKLFMSFHRYMKGYENVASLVNELAARVDITLQSGVPLMASEWGNSEYSGDGAAYDLAANVFIEKLRREKMSWTFWKWTDQDMTTAILNYGDDGSYKYGGWTEEQMNHNGKYMFQYMANDDPYHFNG